MGLFKTDDKTGIFYEQWDAASARAALLLVHGLGAHSGRWQALADFFTRQGFSCYSVELQGFGQTRGLRGHIDSFETYFNDIRRLNEIIRSELPGRKIFLAGESFGGLLAFLLSFKSPELFSGLICLSPAFSIKLQVSFWDYTRVFLHLFLDQQKQFKLHLVGDMCTRDLKYQEQIDHDFREHRLVSAKFVLNYFQAERSARRISMPLRIPVLFLIPGQDTIVSSHISKVIFYRLLARDKTLIKYPEMFHALSVELGKEKVFADMLQWLNARLV